MKKLTKVMASILALSCINLVGCEKDGDSWKVTLVYGDETQTIEVDKDGELKLPKAPIKEGYTFVGWYTDEACTQAFTAESVTENLTLYAKFEAKELSIVLETQGGTFEEGVSNRVKVKHNETYSLPVPSKTNYKFAGWLLENEDGTTTEFPASGTYERTSGCFLTAKWEKVGEDAEEDESQALFLNKGTYFQERASVEDEFTYVFVTGVNYNFSSLKGLEIDGASTSVQQNGLSFTALKAEDDFTLKITKEVDGVEVQYDRKAKIVDQVERFDGGADFLGSWGKSVDRSVNFQDASKTVAATAMAVGKDNYIPDLKMYNDSDAILSMDDANVVVTVKNEANEVVDASKYTVADGVVSFAQDLVGSNVSVTYAPKYSLTNQSLTVNLKVNNGVNVYDNDQLRAAYANDAVSEINILRNIKAVVAPEDMASKEVPLNEYKRAVYARNVVSTDDVITVNGNFFKIDGSELPLMNNDIGGQGWQESIPGWYVPNMQLGIFQYMNITAEDEYIHNGQVTFNDLYITGNYTKADDHTIKYGDRELLTQSGAYHGIVLRGGRATVNNTTIVNTNISLFTGSSYSYSDNMQAGSQWDVNYAKLDHAWGNQVYMYHTSWLDIENSYLGDCGGAAIHLDDCAYNKATETPIESILKVDAATKIENFISGESAYFVSRGMNGLAVETKTTIENTVNPYDMGAVTAIKKVDDNGTEVEMFNLVLLVRSTNSETSDWLEDTKGYPMIDFTSMMALLSNGTIPGYLPFNTANPSEVFPSNVADPVNYMCGLVEVMAK